MTVKKYLGFSARIIIALVVIVSLAAAFIVTTQEYQLLPVLMTAGQTGSARPVGELPPGVEAFYVDTMDFKHLEVWKFSAHVGKSKKEKGIVIFFPGNGEDFSSMQHGTPAAIAEAGFTTYAFTYRGVGRSSGFPSEAGLYLDALAVYGEMLKREAKPLKNLVLFGSSFGTGVAAWLATQVQPKVLVLNAPYPSIPDVVNTRFLLNYLTSMVRTTLPTIQNVPHLPQTTGVIISHGERDTVIPFSLGKRVAAVVNPKACRAFITDPDAGHNDIFWKTRKKIFAELERCLGEN